MTLKYDISNANQVIRLCDEMFWVIDSRNESKSTLLIHKLGYFLCWQQLVRWLSKQNIVHFVQFPFVGLFLGKTQQKQQEQQQRKIRKKKDI